MKYIKLLFLFLLVTPSYAQLTPQDSGINTTLNDVHCITADFVVAVGNGGKILKTINGGLNWTQKSSGITENLLNVQFPSQIVGFAYGANGTLLKSIDSGESWSIISSGQFYYYGGFSCPSETVIYLSGNIDGFIRKSTDGGENFETINIPTNHSVKNIQFLNNQIGFAASLGELYKTTDGGISWMYIGPVNSFQGCSPFYFVNETTGFVNRTDGLYRTTDGGNSYEFLETIPYLMLKIFAPSDNVVWGVTYQPLLNGQDNYTLRGEVTDTGFESEQSNLIFAGLHFANATTGYFVGWDGAIYKTENGLLNVFATPGKESILVYPNPSTSYLNISLGNQSSPQLIKIYDFAMREVYKETFQNNQSIQIDVTAFSAGIYFLATGSGSNTNFQKIIVK